MQKLRIIVNFIYKMKGRRIISGGSSDEKGLSELHNKILDKIAQLDKLNEQYKVKQEHHFVNMFMNVLQKMGNDLILAQQAYRNIDIEVKRDKYIVQLAEQLNFFKTQCFTLKKENNKIKKQIEALKLDNQSLQNEANSMKMAYEKKSKQNMNLKQINSQLKKHLKQQIAETPNSIFKYTSQKDVQMQNVQKQNLSKAKQMIQNQQALAGRWAKSQQSHRKDLVSTSVDFNKTHFPNEVETDLPVHHSISLKHKFRTNNFLTKKKEHHSKSFSINQEIDIPQPTTCK